MPGMAKFRASRKGVMYYYVHFTYWVIVKHVHVKYKPLSKLSMKLAPNRDLGVLVDDRLRIVLWLA